MRPLGFKFLGYTHIESLTSRNYVLYNVYERNSTRSGHAVVRIKHFLHPVKRSPFLEDPTLEMWQILDSMSNW